MTFQIVVHGEIILPISLEQAYDEWLSNLRKPNRPNPLYEESIHSEVGNLAPGSVLKYSQMQRRLVTEYYEVIEHTPYVSFTTQGAGTLSHMEFQRRDASSTIKSTHTYRFAFNRLGLKWILLSTRLIRGHHFMDVNEWGHHFPNETVKAKYSCRIMGLPHFVVMIPAWLILFLILSALYASLRGMALS